MNKKLIFPLLLLIALGLSSCGYEEGPYFSVIPKTERVANTWIAEKSFVDGVETTGLAGFSEMTLYKEGNANVTLTAASIDVTYVGDWAFNDDKSAILLTTEEELTGLISYNRTWNIIRLTENEMWLTWTETNLLGQDVSYEGHFAPSE